MGRLRCLIRSLCRSLGPFSLPCAKSDCKTPIIIITLCFRSANPVRKRCLLTSSRFALLCVGISKWSLWTLNNKYLMTRLLMTIKVLWFRFFWKKQVVSIISIVTLRSSHDCGYECIIIPIPDNCTNYWWVISTVNINRTKRLNYIYNCKYVFRITHSLSLSSVNILKPYLWWMCDCAIYWNSACCQVSCGKKGLCVYLFLVVCFYF